MKQVILSGVMWIFLIGCSSGGHELNQRSYVITKSHVEEDASTPSSEAQQDSDSQE